MLNPYANINTPRIIPTVSWSPIVSKYVYNTETQDESSCSRTAWYTRHDYAHFKEEAREELQKHMFDKRICSFDEGISTLYQP
jgi:hypothetical protein